MSRSRAKGTAWETAVCRYLADHGHPYAERKALRGRADAGDISGVVGWTLEAKSLKQLDVAGAIDEAEKERANTGGKWAAAILKRRMKSTGEGYVVMTLETFARLLSEEG